MLVILPGNSLKFNSEMLGVSYSHVLKVKTPSTKPKNYRLISNGNALMKGLSEALEVSD